MDIIIDNSRKFLKARLLKDTTTLYGFEEKRANIKDLFNRTALHGESNSALLTSPKQGGKTTLVNSVLLELLQTEIFTSKTMIILLNGLIHIDDRQALKSITTQLNLDREVEGRTFNSFSENLTFLLTCLKTGQESQRLIFIIDEFDLFCGHQNQTLLYNLFDVAQSAQTPICVLGLTSRLDVIELLEKRVKSRFSHRQISLWPDSNEFDKFTELVKNLLKLPTIQEFVQLKKIHQISENILKDSQLPFLRQMIYQKNIEFPKKHVIEWNEHIDQLMKNEKLLKNLEDYYVIRPTVTSTKFLLLQIVSKLNGSNRKIRSEEICKFVDYLINSDDKINLILGLSALEVCLLIAIKHHCDIYDNDPFNFEMILTRFNKFALSSSTLQNIDREMVLKSFETLRHQEFMAPVGVDGKVQKEYQMYKLMLLSDQIDKAIQKYQNVPTEVEQWAKSSII